MGVFRFKLPEDFKIIDDKDLKFESDFFFSHKFTDHLNAFFVLKSLV